MITLTHLREGLRMFNRARLVRKKGIKHYHGNAEQICRSIVNDCFNGRYFQTSTGHFCEFYTRDFGLCIEALLNLGYKKKVEQTLQYVLERFQRNNRIMVAITPSGKPFDFPNYATDSVPFIVRSLRLLNNTKLINQYADFLNNEIQRYYEIVFDPALGLVRNDRHFSSIKDNALRVSSCYDNVMVAMLHNELKNIDTLDNPFKGFNFKKNILDHFWTGTHFRDELNDYDFVTGDANIFPFWSGLFTSRKMLRSCVDQIQKNGLDKPFPLRYYHTKIKQHKMITIGIFAPDYERDTIWTQLGPLYIGLLRTLGEAEPPIELYRSVIELNKNYLEIFDREGKPYKSLFYYSDEGMLWASLYLDLIA